MWTLEQLHDYNNKTKVHIDGKWIPGRPENYKKKYRSFRERLRDAWEVFQCRAEAFTWPSGQ